MPKFIIVRAKRDYDGLNPSDFGEIAQTPPRKPFWDDSCAFAMLFSLARLGMT